ncbi:MAG: hypothetical protein ACKOAO_00050 [Oxalobacteraceae bacterium]
MKSRSVIPLLMLLASCASTTPADGRIEILTTSRSQPLEGAQCEVEIGVSKWTITTPGSLQVGEAKGDLSVVCNKEGYRTSEVVFRHGSSSVPGATRVGVGMGGGFGGYSGVGISLGFGFPLSSGRATYPARVVVDMTPM